MSKKEWWKTFFDEHYLTVWKAVGRLSNTKKEISFLEKIVPLRKKHKILDLCCGHGRHSIELAKRGYQITGFDYSPFKLKIAKAEAVAQGLKINFVQGDARNLKLREKFDVILNLFSSAVGYGSEKDTRAYLKINFHNSLIKSA